MYRTSHFWLMASMIAFLLTSVSGWAGAQEETPLWRTTADAFVADEALVETVLPPGLKPQPAQGEWEQRGEEVVFLALVHPQAKTGAEIAISADGARVLGYRASFPYGPYPTDEISREEAEPTALAFALRHLPELSEPGGEIEVIAEDDITSNGTRLFHIYRLVDGVRAPLRADVGVRVWDGSVAYWRGEAKPLTTEPAPTLDTDQAAAGVMPALSLVDQLPVYSPDGEWLYFLSNRPRPGYPAWVGADGPSGLFRVRPDGAELECVVPDLVLNFALEPNGGRIVCSTGE